MRMDEEIMTFINSELYWIIAEAEQVYRELPFVHNQALVDQLPRGDEDIISISRYD